MLQWISLVMLFACTLIKKSFAEYNYEKLLQIGQPLVKIQARHSGCGARAATSDEAVGLEAVLFLATKAEVMLACDLWA